MTEVVLGLDQGTSSTRCLVLSRDLECLGAAAVPVKSSFPSPGLVEQDPVELVASARAAMDRALADAGAGRGDVAALGIANQTETFVICERDSGRPIHPAIVWQDRRTDDRCQRLVSDGHAPEIRKLTGLELDATFPATKIGWVLDHLPGAREAAESGEFVYHDVAGWLVRNLCGVELCEVSNAGRTLLCGLGRRDWDDGLLEVFEVPRALLPPIVDSDLGGAGVHGAPGALPGLLPVSGMLGDQQASLFGLGCREPGMAKVTLGTGAFVLANSGSMPPEPPPGVLGSCAWRRLGEASFALEGFVPAAGAALRWLSEIGLLEDPTSFDTLMAGMGPSDPGVVCVPAFQGLGTPSWDASARGALVGLSLGTTRAQLAGAVVDGVLHQVVDALEAIATRVSITEVLVDGGMSRSDWTVQRLADLAGVLVRRAARSESTAIGAAMVAGLAAGVWRDPTEFPEVATDLTAEPRSSQAERQWQRERWSSAVEVARSWGSAR